MTAERTTERATTPRARVVRMRAFAKINLSLRVLGSRSDGYHEVRTVLQSLALHDTLTFQDAAGAFRIACDDEACPTDATNLVWQAAARVWAAAGRRGDPRGVHVRIVKRIAMGAGLGGGSSDAAAAIRALAALWRVELTDDGTWEIARSLGADVPFFLEGGTVLGVERGDVLFPLQDPARAWVVIAIPSFGVSTKEAYDWFDQTVTSSFTSGGARPPLADVARARRVSPPRLPAWPQAPLSLSESSNDLQGAVAAHRPEIARLVKALRQSGPIHAAMSGSGSAVFGLFERRHEAAAAADRLACRGRRVIVTRTVNRNGYRKSYTV